MVYCCVCHDNDVIFNVHISGGIAAFYFCYKHMKDAYLMAKNWKREVYFHYVIPSKTKEDDNYLQSITSSMNIKNNILKSFSI